MLPAGQWLSKRVREQAELSHPEAELAVAAHPLSWHEAARATIQAGEVVELLLQLRQGHRKT